MSFGEHLEELRRRLIYGLVGVGVICVGTLYFGIDIFYWLCEPLLLAQDNAGMKRGVTDFNPAAAFGIYLKVGLISGLVLGSPWVLLQGWRFVEAGLYPAERRVVIILVPFSATMVIIGIAFFYTTMLPICLAFFLAFAKKYPDGMFSLTIQAKEYINFVVYLGLGIVIGFQLPVAMLIGGMSGVLSHQWIAQYRKHALLGCFLAGAFLTPSDPVSMFVLAVPLYALFEFGLILVRLTGRRKQITGSDG